MLQYVIKQKY